MLAKLLNTKSSVTEVLFMMLMQNSAAQRFGTTM
ncbi:UNVERIFIED_CONTAM: hypothetical protein GTU68_020587 [Idotea baltica]|nr:hypothetical protein [Idotea baltica]